jgi:HAD superfamily hydrolase (TIGR01549 family)
VALFDLDDTLVDRASAFSAWARWFCDRHHGGPGDLAWLLEADEGGIRDRGVLLAGLAARLGLEADDADLVSDYWEAYPTFYAPDPAVLEALTGLRAAGWHLAVVTNGPPRQRQKLTRAGLDPLVEYCAVSGELGVAKPDRRIFEAALAGLGVPDGPDLTAWVVGDRAEADIAGGRAMGWPTIWMRLGREWSGPGPAPERSADDVAHAVALLLAG